MKQHIKSATWLFALILVICIIATGVCVSLTAVAEEKDEPIVRDHGWYVFSFADDVATFTIDAGISDLRTIRSTAIETLRSDFEELIDALDFEGMVIDRFVNKEETAEGGDLPFGGIDPSVLAGIDLGIIQQFLDGYLDLGEFDIGEYKDLKDEYQGIVEEVATLQEEYEELTNTPEEDRTDEQLERIAEIEARVEEHNDTIQELQDSMSEMEELITPEIIADVEDKIDSVVNGSYDAFIKSKIAEQTEYTYEEISAKITDVVAEVIDVIYNDESDPEQVEKKAEMKEKVETKVDNLVTEVEESGGVVTITMQDMLNAVVAIKLDDVTVYYKGMFQRDNLVTLLRNLPTPEEISDMNDLSLHYDVAIETEFGTREFELVVRLAGQVEQQRRFARAFSRYFVSAFADGNLDVDFTAPVRAANLLARLLNSERLSQSFREQYMNKQNEFFATKEDLLDAFSLEDLVEALNDMDFDSVLATLDNADLLQQEFAAYVDFDNLSQAKLGSLLQALGSVDKGSLAKDVFVADFLGVQQGQAGFAAAGHALDEVLNQFDFDYVDVSVMHYYFELSAEVGVDLGSGVDRLSDYIRFYDNYVNLVNDYYDSLPAAYRQKCLLDLYKGQGNFAATDDVYLDYDRVFSRIDPNRGPWLATFFEEDGLDVHVDVDVTVPGVSLVSYYVKDELQIRGLLPKGADVVKFGRPAQVDGYDVDHWVDAQGNRVDTVPDHDVALYAVIRVDLSDAEWDYDEAFTYDGNEHTVTVRNIPEIVDVQYSGNAKTNAGHYTAHAEVSGDFVITGWSLQDLDWEIGKATYDLSDVSWDPAQVEIQEGDKLPAFALVGLPSGLSLDGVVFKDALGEPAEEPLEEGVYTVHAVLVQDQVSQINYNAPAFDKTATLTVTAAPQPLPFVLTLSFKDDKSAISGTYDANDHVIEIVCEINRQPQEDEEVFYTFEWSKGDVDLDELDGNQLIVRNVVDSGTYLVRVIAEYGDELDEKTLEVSVAIAPAALDCATVKWDYTEPFVYDKAEHTIALTDLPALLGQDEWSLAYTDASATDAGVYFAGVTLNPDSNYDYVGWVVEDKMWEILKATYNWDNVNWYPASASIEEGDALPNFELVGLPEGVSLAKVVFSDANGEVETPSAVGVYTVSALLAQTAQASYNYNDPNETFNKTTNLTITEKQNPEDALVLTIDYSGDYVGNYDGRDHVITISYDVNKAGSVSYSFAWSKEGKALLGLTGEHLTVRNVADNGVYSVAVTATLGDQSDTKELTNIRVEIAALRLEFGNVTWNYLDNAASFVYNGRAHNVELINLPALKGVDSWDDFLAYTGVYEATEIGEYTASFALNLSGNYTGTGSLNAPLNLTWRIGKGEYDLSQARWRNSHITVQVGSGQDFGFAIDNLPEGVTVDHFEYADANGVVGVPSLEGEYTVRPVLVGADTEHYNQPVWTKAPATLTIVAAPDVKEYRDESGNVLVFVSKNGGLNSANFTVEKLFQLPYTLDFSEINGGKATLVAAYQITTTEVIDPNDSYELKIYVPASARGRKLHAVFIDEQGKVHPIEGQLDADGYMVFRTNHFSIYGVAAEDEAVVNSLTWMWILIAVIIVLLIVIVCLVIALARRKKNEKSNEPDEESAKEEPQPEQVQEESAAEEPVEEEPAEEPVEEEPAEEEPAPQEEPQEEPVPKEEPVAEEATADETPEEEPAQEEPVEEQPQEEPVAEEPVQEEPVEEQPEEPVPQEESVPEEEPAPVLPEVVIPVVEVKPREIKDRSMQARLIQAPKIVQKRYEALKNAALSYKKIHARMAWGYETFSRGRNPVLRVRIQNKTVLAFFALDPNEVAAKYHAKDVSERSKYAKVPTKVKIKSDRALKYALQLLDEAMSKAGTVRGLERADKYSFKRETDEALIEKGLIKIKYSKFLK